MVGDMHAELEEPLKDLEDTGLWGYMADDMGTEVIASGYGPSVNSRVDIRFGFFRCMSYVFFLLHIYAILATIYNGYAKDWYTMSMNFILLVSSFLVAMSSYCHETLSHEVSIFARQNDELAAENESLSSQMKGMEGVKQKYEDILGDLQGDEGTLKELVDSLHRSVLMKNLHVLFSAVAEADLSGDQTIHTKETEVFFSKTWSVLRHVAGIQNGVCEEAESDAAFPLRKLYDEAANAGDGQRLDKDDVKLLVYACGLSGDSDRPDASRALLWMVLFFFNPDIYAQGLTESLIAAILGAGAKEQDQAQMRLLVQTIKESHVGAFKYSDDERCKAVVDRILQGSFSNDAMGGSLRPTPCPTPRVIR